MSASRLSPLQSRILELLSGIQPRWTLTGGAALAGFHLRHRSTRDLDLFWHGVDLLGDRPETVARILRTHGLEVEGMVRSPSFARFRVAHEGEVTLIDLVAEPVPTIQPPEEQAHRQCTILVDTPHEILVNKLCTLLSRAEIRDLLDLQCLLRSGGDLERGLRDAPEKDGGFSPLQLAWILRDLPVRKLAESEGIGSKAGELEQFRDELVGRLLEMSHPDG